MGKNEAASPKAEKTSSPVQEVPTVHAYPDWATMQAYYAPGVAITPSYFSHGHAPHPYMWHPQPLMPPFGALYAALYPHGVYPSVPLGPHSHCQGISPSSIAGEAVPMTTPFCATPGKSSSNRDSVLSKKLKRPDGLAVPVGNSNADKAAGGIADSHSGESSGEGSSDGSDGNSGANGKKNQGNSSDNQLALGKDGKAEALVATAHGGETNATPTIQPGTIAEPANVTKELVDSKPSSIPRPSIDLRICTGSEVKSGVAPVTPPAKAMMRGHGGVPCGLWIQDERELKQERRKQSNRESARRSRLRKQAETEELAQKVEALSAESTQLRSEITRLIESSEKLKQENAMLMEKLQHVQRHQVEEIPPGNVEADASVGTENLLSKINNPSSIDKTSHRQNSSTSKFQQLLSRPRSNTIAAG